MNSIKTLAGLSFGYIFDPEVMESAIAMRPDVIVAQGTSSDSGPSYYGTGKPHFPRENIFRGLESLILAARRLDIPFVMSLGSSGTEKSLDYVLTIVDDIVEKHQLQFKAAVISGEVSKDYLRDKLRAGVAIPSLVKTPALSRLLTSKDIDSAMSIVGQMGPEPVIEALKSGVDGVFTGRALDSGLFMALPMMNGIDKGIAAHFGMVMACGAMAAVPGGIDLLSGEIDKKGFFVIPPNPARQCTPMSLAAHTLYEQPDAGIEYLPGGLLDTTKAVYTQQGRGTRVTGSVWESHDPYTVKLEAAVSRGFRTICLAGVRDPVLLGCLDGVLEKIRASIERQIGLPAEIGYQLDFRVYGRDAVMGGWEQNRSIEGHEVGVLIDVVATTQEKANYVCSMARGDLHMNDYPGRKSTAGNVALAFSPSEVEMGETFGFHIWHLLPLDNPSEPFRTRIREFGGRRKA